MIEVPLSIKVLAYLFVISFLVPPLRKLRLPIVLLVIFSALMGWYHAG